MTVDVEALTIISILSTLVGAALFVRAKVEDSVKRFESHERKDESRHSENTSQLATIFDRLARIETKIDNLTSRGGHEP